MQVSERHGLDAGPVVAERGQSVQQRAAVDRPEGDIPGDGAEPGIDQQRPALAFDEQAPGFSPIAPSTT
jgi:hypothetical protein